ncbi:MAG: GTP-binding protein HflX [Parasphingorhabdus sp.]
MSDLQFSALDSGADDFEGVILVHQDAKATAEDIEELHGLAVAAGGQVLDYLLSQRSKPINATLLGKGKVQELTDLVSDTGATLVVFNQSLSPIQERNIEQQISCRVIDRTRLILDIFALRASTSEGKLQVELAQLRHMATRLVRGWTHLERQKGGIGLRGPGETQLETDRRLLNDRIRSLKRRLQKVGLQRKLRRRSRQRAPVPTVSLVGYTNAGKSTLFNKLTGADVYAEDKLFATLDPTMRRYKVADTIDIVLSDTVGFISDLPHTLVEAFHSTLEEVLDSTLLLHIADSADPERDERIRQVQLVLNDIGAGDIPQILVMNKIDQLEDSPITRNPDQETVWLSAVNGVGLDQLDQKLEVFFSDQFCRLQLRLPPDAGKLRASLYQHCKVLTETCDDEGKFCLEVEMAHSDVGWLENQPGFKTGFWIENSQKDPN